MTVGRRHTDGCTAPPTGTRRSEDDPVRAAERLRLAHELYDIVAHHLSNVTLRTMGRLDLADLINLRHVLGDVNSATASALVELRLLAHVLGDELNGAVRADGIGALSQRLTPTAAATQWRRRLTQTGRLATYQVPDAADHLPLSVQTTITRTFGATAEATLRYATLDARSSTTVHIGSTSVTVRSVTTLPRAGPAGPDELGHGLRGLRERVDLTHGQFSAALDGSASPDPEWVVTVTLPLE
jgi:signal transduction histidine kinase